MPNQSANTENKPTFHFDSPETIQSMPILLRIEADFSPGDLCVGLKNNAYLVGFYSADKRLYVAGALCDVDSICGRVVEVIPPSKPFVRLTDESSERK